MRLKQSGTKAIKLFHTHTPLFTSQLLRRYDIQHNDIQRNSKKGNTQHNDSVVMLSDIKKNVEDKLFMLNVVMLNVVVLSVVAQLLS
jgi:hypothetical protein